MPEYQFNRSQEPQPWEVGGNLSETNRNLALFGARKLRNVTKSDTADLQVSDNTGTNYRAVARFLYVAGGTTVNVLAVDDWTLGMSGAQAIAAAVSFPIPSGGTLRIDAHTARVLATGTDATTIIAAF